MTRWSLLAAVSGAVLAAGCSVHVEGTSLIKEPTTGESGTLRFQYGDFGCGLFFQSCPLDQPFLVGSEADVEIVDGPSSGHVAFAFEGASAKVTSTMERASCDSGSSSRDVDLDAPCGPGETKKAFRQATLAGVTPGDGKLVVRDARTGAEIDRVAVHVANAADLRIEVKRQGPADADSSSVIPDGAVYGVKVSDKVRVRADPLDASGKGIRVGRHGIAHEYGDRAVLAPSTDPSLAIFGSSETEDIVAKQSGETTLVVRAAGVSRTLRFRVARP